MTKTTPAENNTTTPRRLVIFDVDGTLTTHREGGFKFLARAIGKNKEVAEHHAEYERRKHLGPWGLDELAQMLEGVSEEKLCSLSEEFCTSFLMTGAKEAVETLRQQGFLTCYFSSNPISILEALQNVLGKADALSGNVLEFVNGICTGKLLRKVDRYVKAEDAKRFIEQHHLLKENVWIIGDSITDVPMAQYGTFIAFNCGKPDVEKHAQHIVRKTDVREAVKVVMESE